MVGQQHYRKVFGIIAELEHRYLETQGDYSAMEIQNIWEETCPKCLGFRLKPEILAITVDKKI